MKILVVADEESKYLWEFKDKQVFEDIDLIISAGDLKASYLSFLTTMSSSDVLYIHGNHDYRYIKKPPLGCYNLEDRIAFCKGKRILGLGGSINYNDGIYQYTEEEMKKRVKKIRYLIKQFGGIDIVLTHSPIKGIGDGEDYAHKGFEVFKELLDEFKPDYFIHGHQHLNYSNKLKRVLKYKDTIIVNGYKYYKFDYKTNNKNDVSINILEKIINTIKFYIKSDFEQMKMYWKYKKAIKS